MPRHPRLVLLGLFAFTVLPVAFARKEPTKTPPPELGVVLLNPEIYFSENFADVTTFAEGTKPILETARAALAAEKHPPRLLVQVTLRRAGEPQIELAGDPALRAEFAEPLLAKLRALPLPRPLLCDIAVRFQTLAKGEEPFGAAAAYSPRLPLPANAAMDRFTTDDLAGQFAQLRTWAREEAIPLAASRACRVDPKFVGVINTGRTLSRLDRSTAADVGQLLYRNPDFWRGVMEMAPGDELIGAMPLLLHVANGEIAKAIHLYPINRFHSQPQSPITPLLERLGLMLETFARQHGERVQRGIALHDKGRFDDAIATYRQILADYPGSAWARYELYYSQAHLTGPLAGASPEALEQAWFAAADEIYRLDPLYEMQATGIRGRNFGSMIDRLTLRSFQENKSADVSLVLPTTAEIALHLECYGEAALLFWHTLHRKGEARVKLMLDKEPRTLTTDQVIARYLYCLERLGVPEWKSQFQGDFAARFAELDAALEKHRRQ